jgi:pantetheine-phosphate adenylyltransferase
MAESSSLAVFAGSFDPLTNGHVDVVERAARVFGRVIVAVGANPSKQAWMPVADRVRVTREATAHISGAEVDSFEGLLADYVRRRGATVLVRGVRSAPEFVEESQMAQMNRHLNSALDTVFLVPPGQLGFISSRLVREIASLGGSLDGLVPPAVTAYLAARRAAAHTQKV